MSDPRKQRDLLDDVLAEASPPDFRATLLDETLRLARRRRRWRQARGVSGVVGLLLLGAWLGSRDWQPKLPSSPALVQSPTVEACHVVSTQPLAAARVVNTQRFTGETILSASATVREIASSSGGYRLIDDAQLLALFGGKAMLVRTGPDSEELVLAEPMQGKTNRPQN